MSDAPAPAPAPTRNTQRLVYAGIAGGAAVLTILVLLLWRNIVERQEEGRQHVFRVVELAEDTVDPAVWGRNYPRQYDSYLRTVDTQRTRHGGSDAFNKLEEVPLWREIFRGYAFGVDYREERGHAYMLSDQDETERVKRFKQPGACLHCHASVIPAYAAAGKAAGEKTRPEQILKGFQLLCGLPYPDARQQVTHPISCLDCHDPQTLQLRVTRPGFLIGLKELVKSGAEVPHFPSIARWRKDKTGDDYDPNRLASRQEMRSMVCTQCHVEYYFKGDGKLLTYPWSKGIRAEQIEAYYDEAGFNDWVHPRTGAPVLKAQHPEFELWSQGIHARSGVSCADCHMPYVREGAIKVSNHHVRSPLLNVAASCQTCHRYGEDEILARAHQIQDRTRTLMVRAEEAVVGLIEALEKARTAGAADDVLARPRRLHRKSQWRLDFVAAENSMGFHAGGEAARLLAEAIDFARQGQLEAATLKKPGP